VPHIPADPQEITLLRTPPSAAEKARARWRQGKRCGSRDGHEATKKLALAKHTPNQGHLRDRFWSVFPGGLANRLRTNEGASRLDHSHGHTVATRGYRRRRGYDRAGPGLSGIQMISEMSSWLNGLLPLGVGVASIIGSRHGAEGLLRWFSKVDRGRSTLRSPQLKRRRRGVRIEATESCMSSLGRSSSW
jgi:hypothetical protein